MTKTVMKFPGNTFSYSLECMLDEKVKQFFINQIINQNLGFAASKPGLENDIASAIETLREQYNKLKHSYIQTFDFVLKNVPEICEDYNRLQEAEVPDYDGSDILESMTRFDSRDLGNLRREDRSVEDDEPVEVDYHTSRKIHMVTDSIFDDPHDSDKATYIALEDIIPRYRIRTEYNIEVRGDREESNTGYTLTLEVVRKYAYEWQGKDVRDISILAIADESTNEHSEKLFMAKSFARMAYHDLCIDKINAPDKTKVCEDLVAHLDELKMSLESQIMVQKIDLSGIQEGSHYAEGEFKRT